MLSTDLQKRFMQLNLNTTELEYSSIYLTHALFGICQTWIAHGKKESPQEITDFLMKMGSIIFVVGKSPMDIMEPILL